MHRVPQCYQLLAFCCNKQDRIFYKSSLHNKRLPVYWRMSAREHTSHSKPYLLPRNVIILHSNTKPLKADRTYEYLGTTAGSFWTTLPKIFVPFPVVLFSLDRFRSAWLEAICRRCRYDASCHLLATGNCHCCIIIHNKSLAIIQGQLVLSSCLINLKNIICRWCLHDGDLM